MSTQSKSGWLMFLRHSEDSAWGAVDHFLDIMRADLRSRCKFTIESPVWGTLLYKDTVPEPGNGFAFYHNTRARFPDRDTFGKKPRITLIGKLLDLEYEERNVTWIKVEVDPKVQIAMERSPIVRDKETDDLFKKCGMIPGPTATFYPVPPEVWREFMDRVVGSITAMAGKGRACR